MTYRSKGIACERCEEWFHVECAVMRGLRDSHMKMLKNKNLLFVCNACLKTVKLEWKAASQKKIEAMSKDAQSI